MSKLKMASIFMLMAIMLVSLAGCGGNNAAQTGNSQGGNSSSNSGSSGSSSSSSSSSSSGTSSKSSTVTVTLMTWESKTMNQSIMDTMKDFESAHPNIKVKLVPAPLSDYGTKLNAMITANKAPDIFEAGNDMVVKLSQKGLLHTWNDLAEKSFLQGFYPGTIDTYTVNGKLSGFPGLLNVYGYFYNKKAFKNAGLDAPKPGWTYADMFKDAKVLSAKQTNIQKYGLIEAAAPDPFRLSLYSVSSGGPPFADNMNHVTKVQVSQQMVKGVEYYRQGIKDKSIAPMTYKTGNIMSLFKQGLVPLVSYGQWAADDFIRNAKDTIDWGYAPNPIVNKNTAILDAVGWASPKGIKNPKAVYEVLKYLDSTTYEKVLPKTPVAPPAYQPSAAPYFKKLVDSGHQDLADGIKYMLNAKDKQPVRFFQDFAGKANTFITADWSAVMDGKKPVSTLQDMVKKINGVIPSN